MRGLRSARATCHLPPARSPTVRPLTTKPPSAADSHEPSTATPGLPSRRLAAIALSAATCDGRPPDARPFAASTRGPPSRRKRPHTTHLEGFPPSVTITRPHHPFEGRALAVLGWTHRSDQLHLVLVLPDGSRSLIPAAWTDFKGGVTTAGHAHRPSLAALPDLVQARAVVDALLRRLSAAGEPLSPPDAEEGHRAIDAEPAAGARPRGPRV